MSWARGDRGTIHIRQCRDDIKETVVFSVTPAETEHCNLWHPQHRRPRRSYFPSRISGRQLGIVYIHDDEMER